MTFSNPNIERTDSQFEKVMNVFRRIILLLVKSCSKAIRAHTQVNMILKREVYVYWALLSIFEIENMSSFEFFLCYLQIRRIKNKEVFDKLKEDAPLKMKSTIERYSSNQTINDDKSSSSKKGSKMKSKKGLKKKDCDKSKRLRSIENYQLFSQENRVFNALLSQINRFEDFGLEAQVIKKLIEMSTKVTNPT